MREVVKNRCDLLFSNKEVVGKEFKWGYSIMNIAASLVFAGADRQVDVERLKECRKIIKKNTGIFSSLQGNAEAIVASKMALSNDPEQYFKDVKSVYDKLSKAQKFSDGGYLISAAVCIVDADRVADADNVIARFSELFKKMNKIHPLLTSSSDIAFAVLLVLTDKPVDSIVAEMEKCYEYVKKDLKVKVGSNEIQGLSEILALSDGDMKAKCDEVVSIYDTFKAHGIKWGKEYNEFASLGALIGLDVDKDTLVDEIAETAEYIKSQKGFGSWTLDNKQRLMFAAMLVGDSYGMSSIRASSAINSTIAMVIAEEVAIMMCIIICTTSASSSAN